MHRFTEIRFPKKIFRIPSIYFFLYLFTSFLALGWYITFIYNNSTIALDGKRYFVLFDDAMISMRYAWNFAHGNGLVWNIGEYVEGYTNLLMTLIMSLFIKVLNHKIYSVLAVQLFGIIVVYFIGFTTASLTNHFYLESRYRKFAAFLAYTFSIFYFPIVFWSVTGMESGLLTLFLSLALLFVYKWQDTTRWQYLNIAIIFCGLGFLTRNDSLLLTGMLLCYCIYILMKKHALQKSWGKLFTVFFIFGLFVIFQEMFRIFYYHNFFPNTYTLKMIGLPLSVRLSNGWAFVSHYLLQSKWLLALALLALVQDRRADRFILAGLWLITIVYQIWVGGDPWGLWRMMIPAMPGIFILAIIASQTIGTRIMSFLTKTGQIKQPVTTNIIISSIILIISLYSVNIYFSSTISGEIRYNPFANAHINQALAINEITNEDATIGVFWAGTLPYYTDRKAIDFLGKADPHIALLTPVIYKNPDELGMTSIPGHNKYDLNYSIQYLKPDYIQDAYWGVQDLREWAKDHYINGTYFLKKGDSNSLVRLKLLKDSSHVFWNKIFSGKIK